MLFVASTGNCLLTLDLHGLRAPAPGEAPAVPVIPGLTDLVFYDRSSGQGEFYATDGQGGLAMIGATDTGWRTSWSLIVPGTFY